MLAVTITYGVPGIQRSSHRSSIHARLPAANLVDKVNIPAAARLDGLGHKCNDACYLRDVQARASLSSFSLAQKRLSFFLSVLLGPLDGESKV
jgi:hypothetical protein